MNETIAYVKELVLKGGLMLRNTLFHQIKCSRKNNDPSDLLTLYDKQIEIFLITSLTNKYLDHKFISEEKENQEDLTGYVWIIDPIDGTTNFICFQRDFSISIALYHDGKPIFGIVYDVMNDNLYLGISGVGSYINDKKIVNIASYPLEDSILDISINTVEILYNRHHINAFDLAPFIRGHRCNGVASLAICKIAMGEIQIYISAKLKGWDFAAAGIILTEVGGYYHNFLDDKLKLTGEPMTIMAASSSEIYEQIKQKLIGNVI